MGKLRDNSARRDYEEITLITPLKLHIREKIAAFADEENMDFDMAFRQLIDDGLKQHGLSLYEDVPTYGDAHFQLRNTEATVDVKIKLTTGERLRADELAIMRGYADVESFYCDTLKRLRGGNKLKLEYRDYIRQKYMTLGGDTRTLTIRMPVTVYRRVSYLTQYTGRIENDLFKLILYINLDAMVVPKGTEPVEIDE